MSKQLSNVSQKENIHRRAQWIERFLQKQEGKLSPKNLQFLYDYNDDMIISSLSENTRYKNLAHFDKLTKMLQKGQLQTVEEAAIAVKLCGDYIEKLNGKGKATEEESTKKEKAKVEEINE